MSAVMKPGGADAKSSEQAFFDSQVLPPEKRGVTFAALFFKQLQTVSTRIHDTENIDQLMLEVSEDICKLFNADRLTIYAVTEDGSAIISKVKTGLNTSRALKLPISPQSLAGYAAFLILVSLLRDRAPSAAALAYLLPSGLKPTLLSPDLGSLLLAILAQPLYAAAYLALGWRFFSRRDA